MDNGQNEILTKKIKVYGIVQGVGFRPLVYRIARKHEINGNVRNVGGYVEIIAQGSEESIEAFLTEIIYCKSCGCEIIKMDAEKIPPIDSKDFIIIRSEISEEVSIIPPDLPVCQDCQEELYDEKNRRNHNPFISCMSCGPRYTIMEELPYDRLNTTMKDFNLCESCKEEYTSPKSRRFHAQTISCNDCGPYLIYFEMAEDRIQEQKKQYTSPDIKSIHHDKLKYASNENSIDWAQKSVSTELRINNEAINKAVTVLKEGGIIAVKGIGGYHFVCTPFLDETVKHLRILKGREEKPFAVMFPSIQEIEKYCDVSEEERGLLQTKARPIVLLKSDNKQMAPSTNKASMYCGAFLPYTPLQVMLLRACGPLIMTSANISDQPILREDTDVLSLTSPYLKGVLYNTRRIVRSVDDSVAKIIDGKPQLIRRSRGYVPFPVFINTEELLTETIERTMIEDIMIEDTLIESTVIKDTMPERTSNEMIFAAGGDLKAAYCLYHKGKAVISQYFGDLEEVSVMEEYKKSIVDLSGLLKIKPVLAVCDLHPNYHSVQFTKDLGIPFLQVQHHHAHIASVMAEHDLKGKVIGVAFDGTGYGTDGTIWGGEFLVCEGADYIRAAHLSYTTVLGGDQSMKDAKKTASCYLLNTGLEDYVQDDRKVIIHSAIHHRVNSVLTSSMGRLFDAVASILNIGQDNRYEGECAALLERKALLAIRNNVEAEDLSFAITEKDEIIEMNPKPLLEALCKLRNKREAGALALGFHYAVSEAIGEICEALRKRYHSNVVALSGGVFQNTILTEQTLKVLRQRGFEVFVNLAVPPNDGGISLGQTYVGLYKNR